MVVALPSLILMAWLGAQIGFAMRAAGQAQVAADAAALAAAARHADGFEAANQDAITAAQGCLGPNGPVSIAVGNSPAGGGDVEFGRWDTETRTFVPDADGGPAVRVTVRFASDNANGAPKFIGWQIFDGDGNSAAFVRRSVAVYNPPTHITSMLVQNQGAGAVDLDASASLVARGGLSVASTDGLAVSAHGVMRQGASLSLPIIRVAGSVDELVRGSGVGSIEEGAEIPADPLAAVTLPSIDAAATGELRSDSVGTTRVAPGAHERLEATAGTVVLEAGVHQFTQGVTLSGSASLVLEDAAIQLAPTATLSIAGSVSVSGTCLQDGDWAGTWLMQRGAASSWSFGGDATLDVQGRAYGPGASVTVAGDAAVSMGSAIVGGLRLADESLLRLGDRIEALDLAVVPGRARLVK